MEDIKFRNAYSEVLEILKYISANEYKKIPESKIKLFQAVANKEYKFVYNPELTLDEQNVSKIAKCIIAILFRDYWATEEQKNKIIAKQNQDRQRVEEEKRKLYNPNNIFKDRQKPIEYVEKQKENTEMAIYKESLFNKIISRIKLIFHK